LRSHFEAPVNDCRAIPNLLREFMPSDYAAIMPRLRSVCAAFPKRFQSDREAFNLSACATLAVIVQRLQSVCKAVAQRLRSVCAAFAQRLRSDCDALPQRQ
jgi:hypothetical protein